MCDLDLEYDPELVRDLEDLPNPPLPPLPPLASTKDDRENIDKIMKMKLFIVFVFFSLKCCLLDKLVTRHKTSCNPLNFPKTSKLVGNMLFIYIINSIQY